MSRFLKVISLALFGALTATTAHASCTGSTYCGAGSQFTWAPQTTSYNMSLQTQSAQSYSFSGSPLSVPGLGQNESLRPTSCPTAVHNPEGGQVLGCYNVVKAVPQTTYYRVVRPIIYVRYPIPTPVVVQPYNSCPNMGYSSGFKAHHAPYGHSVCR